MKRILLLALTAALASGCAAVANLRDSGDTYENPFYAKYLNTGSALDAEISSTLDQLRANPDSAELHNYLGALLVDKGFPKDAEREFERAIAADRNYHPAWYNLGLVRAMRGNEFGARLAYGRTIREKPGHAAALFQLGLIEEERGNRDRAVELYAKAFAINPALLDVEVNPRILDTKLMHLALLKNYPLEHTRESMQFENAPNVGTTLASPPQPPEAPSPQEAPQEIVPPAPPVTDPAMQPATPTEQRPRPRPRRRSQPDNE
jgi:tetratricopeptide (TPR) repeat protein